MQIDEKLHLWGRGDIVRKFRIGMDEIKSFGYLSTKNLNNRGPNYHTTLIGIGGHSSKNLNHYRRNYYQ